ncbi:unnamed protein product, partial [Didymodactylos carnosus]
YFECLPNDDKALWGGLDNETSIRNIAEQIQTKQSQTYYVAARMRVFTIENSIDGYNYRQWYYIEPQQLLMIEKVVYVEYTPTEADNLTEDDYTYTWVCFGKVIRNRSEAALKCITQNQLVVFIPYETQENVSLYPVAQMGSANTHKLHTIANLVGKFQMPLKVKSFNNKGNYAYQNFSGYVQLLGTRTDEFAICGSLSTINVGMIPTNIPMKFVAASLIHPQLNQQSIQQSLLRCQILNQYLDVQIRRIQISHGIGERMGRNRSRFPKIKSGINEQLTRPRRSNSEDETSRRTKPSANVVSNGTTKQNDIDEGYGSRSRHRSASNTKNQTAKPRGGNIRQTPNIAGTDTVSTDDSTYDSLFRIGKAKAFAKTIKPRSNERNNSGSSNQDESLTTDNTSDALNNLIENLDMEHADGAILIDTGNELLFTLNSSNPLT